MGKRINFNKILSFISGMISIIVIISAILIMFGGKEIIANHLDLKNEIIVVLNSDTLGIISTDNYDIKVIHDEKNINIDNGKGGYSFAGGYGKYEGTALIDLPKELSDKLSKNNIRINFGFYNTNNWHRVRIILTAEISEQDDKELLTVVQRIIYMTDNNIIINDEDKNTFNLSDNEDISLFQGL